MTGKSFQYFLGLQVIREILMDFKVYFIAKIIPLIYLSQFLIENGRATLFETRILHVCSSLL